MEHYMAAAMLDEYRSMRLVSHGDLPEDVRHLLSHLNRNIFNQDLDVGGAKERCRIKCKNYSSRFRHFVGYGIKEYIKRHRMLAAAMVLRECKSLEICQVAFMVGYRSHSAFSASVQSFFGQPPSVVRLSVHTQCTNDRETLMSLS